MPSSVKLGGIRMSVSTTSGRIASTASISESTSSHWASSSISPPSAAGNWADTSTQVIQNPAVQTQVSSFLVDQLYTSVDVQAELAKSLPPRLKPLAAPVAGGLRSALERTTNLILQRPRFQQAWKVANRITAQQFINIAEGKSKAITQQGNAVVL